MSDSPDPEKESSAAQVAAVAQADADPAHARTLAGDSGPAPSPSSPISGSGFPVPNWDRYEFLSLLGRGGMGAVYRARDRRLDREVALKFIHGDDPAMIGRFMQEARAQARLDHDNICKVYETGEVNGKPYIAMQLVDGLPLDKASRSMSLLEKAQVVRDAARALHAAHMLGIIHRDVKPSNILVERIVDGTGTAYFHPIIMDFGLARESGESKGITESGAVLGTPAYMSPEQARGDVRHLDCRTDVYSLGAAFYDILTGKPPFDDATVVNIILKVINDNATPLRRLDATLPEALELVVSKCLNKEAAQRYPTASALADDLDRYLTSQRVVAKRLGYWYRLVYWARRNKTLAAVAVALLLSLSSFAISTIRTRIQNARKEAAARIQAELAQKLGQDIKDMEWLMRTARLLPLHNAESEKEMVRLRMRQLADRAQKAGALGEGLGHYGLGRGHLALHDFNQAHEQLQQARNSGVKLPELHFALGQVLGELFNQALEDARRSGDKSFVEKRRGELERQYLTPALFHLQTSKQLGLQSESPSFVEGLIAFYGRQDELALRKAEEGLKEAPWLYETRKLQGDVYLNRALDFRDRGKLDDADQSFALAVRRYEEAADIGRSDYQIHQMIAEAWVRQMEMDAFQRGQNPEKKLEKAIAAADKAIATAPTESYGYSKKAYAYLFQVWYFLDHGTPQQVIDSCKKLIQNGENSISLHPADAYAHDVTGNGYVLLSQQTRDNNALLETYSNNANEHFQTALKLNSFFPWAYNDLGISYLNNGTLKKDRNQDPTNDLSKSIELYKKAIEIDPSYVYAHANLTVSYKMMAKFLFESGKDPAEWVNKVEHSAEYLIRTNPNDSASYYATGETNVIQGYYYLMAQKYDHEIINKALTELAKGEKIDTQNPKILENIAMANYIQSKYDQQNPARQQESLLKGLSVTEKCIKLAPQHANCRMAQGLLLALKAAAEGRQQVRSIETWNAALSAAQKATALDPAERETWLALADTIYQQQTVTKATNENSAASLAEGEKAIDRALTIAPDWPRALAVKGLLRLAAARMSHVKKEQVDAATQATALFGRAGQSNPLISTYYRSEIEELRSLASY